VGAVYNAYAGGVGGGMSSRHIWRLRVSRSIRVQRLALVCVFDTDGSGERPMFAYRAR